MADSKEIVERLSERRFSKLSFHELNKQWLEQKGPKSDASLEKTEHQIKKLSQEEDARDVKDEKLLKNDIDENDDELSELR